MDVVYKTCPHCNSKYSSDKGLDDNTRYCPMCNMRKDGQEKEKDTK